MIKKYRTGSYGEPIEVVEVDRETEKSVWIKGHRNEKITNYHSYFDSWSEAHDYLVKKFRNEMSRSKAKYDGAKNRYQEVLSLKEISK